MATPRELGDRVTQARLARRWGVKRASEEAGIARETWMRVEDGLGVQDAKRAAVLAALGLDEEGRSPQDLARETEKPVATVEDLSRLPGQLQELQARVASLEERLDALEHPGLHAVKAARTGERQPQEQSHSDHDGIDAPGHPDGA